MFQICILSAFAAGTIVMTAGCEEESGDVSSPAENAATQEPGVATAPAAQDGGDAGDRFHPLKAYTVTYTVSGTKSGTVTEYSRDYGRERVTVENSKLSMAGMNIAEDKRVLIRGPEIVTIDNRAKTVSRTTNPLYEPIAESLKGKDIEEVGRAFYSAMGHKPTGERKSIAGEDCEVWKNAQLNQELCITSDSLMLHMDTRMGGMSMVQTTTNIRRHDSGPDEVYQIPDGLTEVKIPDLGQLLGKRQP
jgi:hypothetical protein